jgi:hypothetical protein
MSCAMALGDAETFRNIGLWAVRPAEFYSAAHTLFSSAAWFSGLPTRWAHRLEVYVPKRRDISRRVRG